MLFSRCVGLHTPKLFIFVTGISTHPCHPSVGVGEFLLLCCTAELWVSSWLGTDHNKEQGRLCLSLSYTDSFLYGSGHFTAGHQVSRFPLQRQVAGSRQKLGFMKGQAAASLWSLSAHTVRGPAAWGCVFLTFNIPLYTVQNFFVSVFTELTFLAF